MEVSVLSGAGQVGRVFHPEILSEEEMDGCQGGKLPVPIWWTVISLVISNWGDIRDGFSDGVSGKPPRYGS